MYLKRFNLLLLIVYAISQLSLNAQTNLEEIINDMILPHEGRPHGVPDSFDWAKKPRVGAEAPPETWDAAIAWGQLYEWIDGNPASNTRVQIKDLELHYLSKTDLKWHTLQVSLKVDGAAYVEDFAGDVNKPADKRTESDGSVSVTCGEGYNFHFWPSQGRVKYPKNEVKGCYATVKARLIMDDPEGVDDRESARYVMGVGGDWWESLTAVWDNWTTNWDMGIGRFRFVTSEWKSFNMITLPADTVRKYPPPSHPEIGVGEIQKNEVYGKNFIIYPNPATSMARIKFISQDKGIIKLTAWSSEGKLIHSIADQEYTAGEHILNWDLSMIPKGMYFIKLEGNLNSENSRCIVVK